VFVRLLEYKPRDVAVLVSYALKSMGVDDATGVDVERWVRLIVQNGYTSVLEHAVYTFEAVCSRVCTHQLVRHRIASYTQESMRRSKAFVDEMVGELARKLELEHDGSPRSAMAIVREALFEPKNMLPDIATAVEKAFAVPPTVKEDHQKLYNYVASILQSVEKFYMLLDGGVPLEDARYVLPDSVKTRIVFTMNARELLEVFLPLRMCSRAQWEIRQLAWRVWELLNKVHPEIFSYAGPRCVLLDLRARKKPCTLEEYLKRTCTPTIERCPEGVKKHTITTCILKAQL